MELIDKPKAGDIISRRQRGIINEIVLERLSQDRKWGQQSHDPFTWLAVLGEEVGETNRAALEAQEWRKGHKSECWDPMKLAHYREELIQVAAVALAMVDCLDRRGA